MKNNYLILFYGLNINLLLMKKYNWKNFLSKLFVSFCRNVKKLNANIFTYVKYIVKCLEIYPKNYFTLKTQIFFSRVIRIYENILQRVRETKKINHVFYKQNIENEKVTSRSLRILRSITIISLQKIFWIPNNLSIQRSVKDRTINVYISWSSDRANETFYRACIFIKYELSLASVKWLKRIVWLALPAIFNSSSKPFSWIKLHYKKYKFYKVSIKRFGVLNCYLLVSRLPRSNNSVHRAVHFIDRKMIRCNELFGDVTEVMTLLVNYLMVMAFATLGLDKRGTLIKFLLIGKTAYVNNEHYFIGDFTKFCRKMDDFVVFYGDRVCFWFKYTKLGHKYYDKRVFCDIIITNGVYVLLKHYVDTFKQIGLRGDRGQNVLNLDLPQTIKQTQTFVKNIILKLVKLKRTQIIPLVRNIYFSEEIDSLGQVNMILIIDKDQRHLNRFYIGNLFDSVSRLAGTAQTAL